ncbi:hypothetical protein N7450_010553 [Penicillium hetheringtonii]|uniref:Uncharacterized protein n=1 Tax=Penicillium hetheringtonii TaxID=911720 RepID=A0AAD6DA11_9EURO|nr:hypothetical protein N7450_010553 [Penicillium hetheringtonii]
MAHVLLIGDSFADESAQTARPPASDVERWTSFRVPVWTGPSVSSNSSIRSSAIHFNGGFAFAFLPLSLVKD